MTVVNRLVGVLRRIWTQECTAGNAVTECAALLIVAALALHHMRYRLSMHGTHPLLPLYRGRWLGRHVIANTVDATAFVYDSVSNLSQESVVHVVPVGSHEVSGSHTSDGTRLIDGRQ